MKKCPKSSSTFYCEICNYNTGKTNHFQRHFYLQNTNLEQKRPKKFRNGPNHSLVNVATILPTRAACFNAIYLLTNTPVYLTLLIILTICFHLYVSVGNLIPLEIAYGIINKNVKLYCIPLISLITTMTITICKLILLLTLF